MPEDTTPAEETPKEETGKGLRAQLEQTLAREKKWKTQLLDTAYQNLGLDPNTGLGKAIAKEYEGEPSAEALGDFAKTEYDYTPPDPQTPVNPVAVEIGAEQAKLDAVGQTAGSVPMTPTESEALAKAEAEGDYQTSMSIKSQQVVNDLFKPRR